jgi:hypothetical protein
MSLDTGLTIAELVRDGEGNERDRLALLEEHRAAVKARLSEVQKHLVFIEKKIAKYKETLDE